MKTNNIIVDKSYSFALRAVKAYQFLTDEKKEYVLSKQFFRSSTSIGANVEESIGGHSKLDFINKITVAYKEARETMYWIKLLRQGGYLNEEEAKSLLTDAEEITRILTAIQITSKKRLPKSKKTTAN